MKKTKKNITLLKKLNKRNVSFFYFLLANNHPIDWVHISQYCSLSEYFMREFQWVLSWKLICYYQKLSEKFIEDHKNKVDWYIVSEQQTLSEDFIRKNKDYVFWDQISYSQKISYEFIEEFKDYVNWEYISMKNLPLKFVEKFKDYIDWNVYTCWSSYKMSGSFILRNYDKIKWNLLYKDDNFDFKLNKLFYKNLAKNKCVKLYLLLNYRHIYDELCKSSQSFDIKI